MNKRNINYDLPMTTNRLTSGLRHLRIGFLAGLLLCLFMLGCKKDEVEVDVKDVTQPFLPAPTDNSEEAQLRREFFSAYNSYLLFNDTLQHYETGKDINGEPHYFTEVLDITYEVGMSTTTNNKYTYTLLADMEQKRVAVAYVQEYLLPHITGKLMPYSWLLVDKITREFIGAITSPVAITGQRSVVIACNSLSRRTEAQKLQYSRQVMNAIIAKLASDNVDAFEEFFAVSASYYDKTFTAPKTSAENTAMLNEAGFIESGQQYGSKVNGLYPSQEIDMSSFSRQVAALTPEAFGKKYANFPLVMRKYEIMRNILMGLGYKD